MLEIIDTENPLKVIGLYSQAVKGGSFLFVSGQMPFDPVEKETVPGQAEDRAEQVLKNPASVHLDFM